MTTSTPQQLPQSNRISCRNCGATTDFAVTSDVLKCAFCGSEQILTQPADPNRLSPEAIVSFAVEEEQARAAYRAWLGNGFFRPGDLTRAATLREIRPVFLPFWSFDATARSQWTAMSGRHRHRTESYQALENGQAVTRERQVQETDWFPANGEHEGRYTWELVSASKGLEQKWVDAVEPFNFGDLRQFKPEYLLGRGAEEPALDRHQAEGVARQIVESKEQSECARLVPGDTHRDLRVSTALDEVTARLLYLPVWLAAFAYKGDVYRFVVNGQTGKVTGEAPVSYLKVAMVVGAVVLAILLVIALVSIAR
jgi:hypothetical protein